MTATSARHSRLEKLQIFQDIKIMRLRLVGCRVSEVFEQKKIQFALILGYLPNTYELGYMGP